MRRVIIDTDTAGDDTVAILTALHNFKVEGVTIAGGNVAFNHQVENALHTVEVSGQDYRVPVFKGHQGPMTQLPTETHRTVEEIHGERGMGDLVIEKPKQEAEEQHAVDFIIETVKNNPGEIELLTIAPLTNIAMAIKREPSILDDIKHIWIMGGINNRLGNIGAVAEFNFYVDPEAARIVLHSGVPMTMVTWDNTLDFGMMYEDDIKDIENLNTKGSKFFIDVNMFVKNANKEVHGYDATSHPDALLVAIAADESLMLESTEYFVDIETAGNLTRGYNLVDKERDLNKKSNVRVCEKVDSARFKEHLMGVLRAIN